MLGSWDLRGLVEDAWLAFWLGREVAATAEPPDWYPGDEFGE